MDILTSIQNRTDQPRKLSLRKETLRELTSSELRRVAGGAGVLNPSGGSVSISSGTSVISSGTSVISSGTSVIAPSGGRVGH